MISFLRFSIIFFLLLACQKPMTVKAEEIIEKSMLSYGFGYGKYKINFDFREYHYQLEQNQGHYLYSRQKISKNKKIFDIMTSDEKLKRFENDILVFLEDSIQNVYSNSLNSVIYFFQLPKPLLDRAVNSILLNPIEIEGNEYFTLGITFDQDGGGDDFQDEFRYWVNKENYHIDYLAYNYLTDGGGTRFRKAKNLRKIKGFLFQDYINYKPQVKISSLDSLPLLFEKDSLEILSIIENKNIKVEF